MDENEKEKEKVKVKAKVDKTKLVLGITFCIIGLVIYAAPDSVQFFANIKEFAHLMGIVLTIFGFRLLDLSIGERVFKKWFLLSRIKTNGYYMVARGRITNASKKEGWVGEDYRFEHYIKFQDDKSLSLSGNNTNTFLEGGINRIVYVKNDNRISAITYR